MNRLLLICAIISTAHLVVSLDFTIEPNVASELTGEAVTMNCSARIENATTIFSIQITRQGEDTPLVTLYPDDSTIVHDPTHSLEQITGHIDSQTPRDSFLRIHVAHPKFKDSGVYECDVTYLDTSEKAEITKATAELEVQRDDFRSVVRAIDELRKDKEAIHENNTNHHSEINTNTRLLDEVRKTLNGLGKKLEENDLKFDALLKSVSELKSLKAQVESQVQKGQRLVKLLRTNGCPDVSWDRRKDQCFKLFEDSKSWPEARDVCRSNSNSDKGHLVEIGDRKTNAYIRDMIEDVSKWSYVWIGLNEERKKGDFVWDGSTNRPVTYSNWNPEATYHSASSDKKYYGVMDTKTGLWQTTPMRFGKKIYTTPFVCQIEAFASI